MKFPLDPSEHPTTCPLCHGPLVYGLRTIHCPTFINWDESYKPPHFSIEPIQDNAIQYHYHVPGKQILWCESKMFRIFYQGWVQDTDIEEGVELETVQAIAIRLYNLRAFA